MRNPAQTSPNSAWRGFNTAYTALSTILCGMAIWGGVGYGLDRLIGTKPWLFVAGVLVGHFAAIYLIYRRATVEELHRAP